MATLTKRNDNGKWLLSYIDPFTGKRTKRTLGKDKETAEVVLGDVKKQIVLAKAGAASWWRASIPAWYRAAFSASVRTGGDVSCH